MCGVGLWLWVCGGLCWFCGLLWLVVWLRKFLFVVGGVLCGLGLFGGVFFGCCCGVVFGLIRLLFLLMK